MTEPDALVHEALHETGDPWVRTDTLEAFVRAHYPRLIRLAGLVTRDADQAQDAVQAALERAWRKRDDVRDETRLRPWLDRIVVREAIRQTARRGIFGRFRQESTDWVEYPSSIPEPAEAIILRDAIGRLSPDHRAVIALHLHEGYSVEETANILGIPLDTVRSRLRAARERLRRDLLERRA